MSTTWLCDICQKQTFVNPPSKPKTELRPIETKVPDGVDKKGFPKYKKKIIQQEFPKMTVTKRQNIHTGKIEEIPIQDIEDLKPRTYIVALSAGNDRVQRDFCKECLDEVLPEIKALFNKLAKIESK